MEPIPAASFGKSHIKLIAVSIVLLVAATFMRGGLTLGAFSFSSAESAPKDMTYAEAKAKAEQMIAEQEAQNPDAEQIAQLAQEQLAEIDPNFGGSVLGASVTDDGNLNVDSLLQSDAIKSAKINIYETEDYLQLNDYSRVVASIENKYGSIVLMGALSTREESSLKKAEAGYKNIIAELQQVQVPLQFQEYHRMKLVYYSALATMAGSMATDGPNEQAATAASLFFSLNEKIESLASELESQYGVIL